MIFFELFLHFLYLLDGFLLVLPIEKKINLILHGKNFSIGGIFFIFHALDVISDYQLLFFAFLSKFLISFLKFIILIFSFEQSILIFLNNLIFILKFFNKLFLFLFFKSNIFFKFTLLINKIFSNNDKSINFLIFVHLNIIIDNLIESIYFVIFLFGPLKLIIYIISVGIPAHLFLLVKSICIFINCTNGGIKRGNAKHH